jgi:hypothetical protein
MYCKICGVVEINPDFEVCASCADELCEYLYREDLERRYLAEIEEKESNFSYRAIER